MMLHKTLRLVLLCSLMPLLAQPAFAGDGSKKKLAPTLVELWRVEDSLIRPESVVHDDERKVLYVSNINGSPTEKDGNGYISRISTDGELLEEQWVAGLNAPKGMAIVGEHLYVADIDSLVKISLASGAVINTYPGANAQFLNDVAADKHGNVYVSDSRQQTVYRLHNGNFDVWVDDPRISEPNGLFVRNHKLIIAAGDSSADRPGRERYLQTIKLNNKKIKPLGDTTPLGSLDGIEKSDRAGYFLTDFRSGDIFHYTRKHGATVLANPEAGTADIEYVADTRTLYVPILNTGKLIAYQVLWCK